MSKHKPRCGTCGLRAHLETAPGITTSTLLAYCDWCERYLFINEIRDQLVRMPDHAEPEVGE